MIPQWEAHTTGSIAPAPFRKDDHKRAAHSKVPDLGELRHKKAQGANFTQPPAQASHILSSPFLTALTFPPPTPIFFKPFIAGWFDR